MLPRLPSVRELALQPIKQDASMFQYASEELRGDRQFDLEAIKQDPSAEWWLNGMLEKGVDADVASSFRNQYVLFPRGRSTEP